MLEKIIGIRNDKTIYQKNNEVLKVFHNNYTKAQVLTEALNHTRIEETSLHLPKFLRVYEIDQQWTIAYEHIQGKTLEQLMMEHPEQLENYMRQFVSLHIDVHAIKNIPLRKQKDRLIEKIENVDLTAIKRYDLRKQIELQSIYQSLCHGDFHPSNVVLNQHQELYIIDWSHASLGNPTADVCQTYLEFILNDQIELADMYLSMYTEMSNIDSKTVLSWKKAIAASRLAKALPEEKSKLRDIILSKPI